MSDIFIPQVTNPARDLYKHLFGIAQHASPADLLETNRPGYTSVFYFNNGTDIRVVGNWPWMRGKPPLAIGHFITIMPNGDFVVSASIRPERWYNDERRLLAKYTFLQWQAYVAYKDKAVFVQDHKRSTNCAYRHDAHLVESDFARRRPYLTCRTGQDLLHRDVIYRLYRVGEVDWKIKAVGIAPDVRAGYDRKPVLRKLKWANDQLDANYARAEARYARAERKLEIESWRERGFKRPPRQQRTDQRDKIVRTFIDHSIVYAPKSAPYGQEILPFIPREEAMSHGR